MVLKLNPFKYLHRLVLETGFHPMQRYQLIKINRNQNSWRISVIKTNTTSLSTWVLQHHNELHFERHTALAIVPHWQMFRNFLEAYYIETTPPLSKIPPATTPRLIVVVRSSRIISKNTLNHKMVHCHSMWLPEHHKICNPHSSTSTH